tara:strand:- start:2053 stop:2199 length:147 start_codon:yes stop_codon:yes gene_type:complete
MFDSIKKLSTLAMFLKFIFWIVCIGLVVAAIVNRFSKSKNEKFDKRNN